MVQRAPHHHGFVVARQGEDQVVLFLLEVGDVGLAVAVDRDLVALARGTGVLGCDRPG